ncbi:recombinase family protein [Candidatus Woesebacteria bacterium]|nr:recombinase family protein [Candidatus Woesebacteria bacterium]
MQSKSRYFIYCRKSSEQEDRQILSLPAQAAELQSLAVRDQLTVVDIFQESKSAHTTGRPKFDAMVTRIEAGEANGVIVWDESRLARNSLDGGKLIYMMDLGLIQEIRKPSKIYKNTPDDKSWLSMCFMMSKKESDDKGVNVKRGLRTKAEKGWFPSSWTKAGYMWDKAERGNKSILVDHVRFPLIKQCWELLLTGAYTTPQILRKLNDEWGYRSPVRRTMGGKPMFRSQLYNLFSDPFYYGWYEYTDANGETIWKRGNHEPMITEEQFNRAQMLLGRGSKQRLRKHDFPLTGVIRCGECDAMVTAEEKWQTICSSCKYKFASMNKEECPRCHLKIEEMVNPTLLHYIYYHCTKKKNPRCTQKSIISDDLLRQVDEKLGRMTVSERFIKWALKYLNTLHNVEIESHTATISQLQGNYNDCVKRLDNLVKLKISSGNTDGNLLSDDEFLAQKTSILAEKSTLEERIQNQGQRVNGWLEQVEEHFNFALHARHRFEVGTPEEKREMLVTVGSNLTLLGKTLGIDLQNEYAFLEYVKEIEPSVSERLEHEKSIDISFDLESLWAQNPLVLPD